MNCSTALECPPSKPLAKTQDHPMIEERLINIETKITFQEDLIEELNKTVYQQQRKLERLEAMCVSLAKHIEAMDQAKNDGVSANERPPHY
jgi:SlyX protein